MNTKILDIEIKRYFTISIKKLLTTNKQKIGVIDIEQNQIRNQINNLKSDGLEYSEEIKELNKKFLELELQKPNIDWDTLVYKCTQQMKDKYKDIELNQIIKLCEKTKNIFKKNNYSLESFRKYHNVSSNKSYYKMKEKKGIDTMTNKEKALKTAAIKKAKSTKIFNECVEILKSNNKKINSNTIYEIIKNDFNDCLKLTSIKMYLKEYKQQLNNNIIDCKNKSIEEIEEIINR